ncbi:MAG TPA: ParB/RepB/Spo0J family partition protein [Candidatus Limiplasma sp.]|nr:ParB/RepB/Spo0J family partition protein [Candidatus Limiplasma sp.]HRX07767.1 ParB/RepB/Spo0J family partition protein [Candidatus Limiplasma sp.]
MTKQRLGRGLDILLPQTGTMDDSPVMELPISLIDPNQAQPRKAFDNKKLEELAESIRQKGLLQPILVVKQGPRYRIIAGERRYRASRLAGLQAIPCLIREFDEAQQLEAALIENIQREDLNPIEEAQAIQSLISHFGYTQEEAAHKLQKSRPAVANQLRLLSLPDAVQKMVISGDLTAGHARVLAGISSESRQAELAHLCVLNGYTVRKLEQLAKQPLPAIRTTQTKPLTGELAGFKDTLRETIGVKTDIIGNESKGKIVFMYSSSAELDHLYDVFTKITQSLDQVGKGR